MDRNKADGIILGTLKKVKGIVDASPLSEKHRREILEIEQDAEERSLMGLGKVVNTGVREILNSELIYVALTNMDFDWGCSATMLLKKGQEVVGEEIRDQAAIERLANQKNVWFMHQNFVVYRDKIAFPQDIMKKICHFEIPCLPAEWCTIEDDNFQCHSIIYANPATPCDVYLKEQYFGGLDERGLGTRH
jgi:hypothetical protein